MSICEEFIIHHRTLLHCHFQLQCRRVMVITFSRYYIMIMRKLRVLKSVSYSIRKLLRIFANLKSMKKLANFTNFRIQTEDFFYEF